MPSLSLNTTGILGGSQGLPTEGILGFGAGSSLSVGAVDPSPIPDDGGVAITLTGVFPTTLDYLVDIVDTPNNIDRRCFSGVIGQGAIVRSTDGTTLVCWVPPLPINTGYDVRVTPDIGTPVVGTGLLDVYHRTFTTTLFSIRAAHGRPRTVGPYSIEDED